MSLTRRAFAASAAATLGLASAARGESLHAIQKLPPPWVIAHRGASGERPEHTPMAYKLAIEQGADFIEPDLVITRDGHLVVRHENEIGGTTDVASKAEFTARKTTKVIDGQSIEGWFTEDFTLAELKTLRCRERLPQLRPDNTKYDGREAIPTFEEVVKIARAGGVGIVPEMKHPRHFASVGLPFERRMADALKTHGLDDADAKVLVQCFEIAPLKTLRPLTKARLVQLIDSEGSPADQPDLRYADMITPDGLRGIAAYADAIGPHWNLVVPTDGERLLPATSLVTDARGAGVPGIYPWTLRAESYFLPKALKAAGGDPRAHGDMAAVAKALYEAMVDGFFSDFPGLAVEARKIWAST